MKQDLTAYIAVWELSESTFFLMPKTKASKEFTGWDTLLYVFGMTQQGLNPRPPTLEVDALQLSYQDGYFNMLLP